ncbi:hypothetical protein PFICI_07743 [Pestalotiopsis fici W106-1]|uniref:Prokaryotic-type class I peptide chain release factors domain-containing protein n=1 Tax=Pestalotiopsis fici (strain W106-1 / CGMCC3.15140) TaxID=1229662 RepID=W3X2G6_PESFW|nr:uncharacterized protein PFICI_07743 [Pestalotiopsis fici W106-1]ETS80214.1 hypothetical protein PFICI_07743 [Pestalotiopsis fici W106-1]
MRHAASSWSLPVAATVPLRPQCSLLQSTAPSPSPSPSTTSFSTTSHHQKKPVNLPPRPPPPPESEIDESFLKGSGPGGQKINKTNSAVQLKHLPTGIVVKCQATRSRTENRKIARQLLATRLDDLARGDESRSAVVGEVRRKKRASAAKKKRRKYRKLGEGEEEVAVDEEHEEILEDELEDVEHTRQDAQAQTTEMNSNHIAKAKT